MLVLNISRQYAKIDITTTRAEMNMTTTRPELVIDTEPATVEISQPKGELEIDWDPFRASYGIKTSSQFSRDCADLGRQAALEAIGRIAEEGNRMAQIESGEDAPVVMSAESTMQPAPEVVWSWLAPPDIHYTAHQPVFNPSPGSLRYDFVRGTLNMNYQPAQINIRMAQYPSLKMWITDNSLDVHT
ncbi:DUF6470 family protein [Sporomusa aerivorans]|uniref:DUF6470 family protein n=1 Tax=Sporomusa aerivorans TaxID=204936 RepID=UPI00352B0849